MKHKIQRQFLDLFGWAKAFFWRRQSIYAGLLIALLVGVVWQLSIIPPRAAIQEVEYANSVSSISQIIENPISLPHKALSYVGLASSDSIRIIRSISIIIFGVSAVALYRILKRWHSDRIALFATAMYATNATVLTIGRLGTPLVMLFCWSFVVALVLWLLHGKSRHTAPVTLLILSTLLLYIPGGIYFLLLFAATYINKIRAALKLVRRKSFYVAIGVSLILLAPLVVAVARNTEILRQWLLLPDTINLSSILTNILDVPSAFIYRAPPEALFTIGRLPILDVASGGLFLIGLYAYQRYVKLERTRFMIITTAIAIVLGALGQTIAAIVIVLPYAFIVIAAGLSYLLDQWYSVFPKNPIARTFGFLLLTLLICFSVYYQLYRFFIAWPQSPETRAVYDQVRLIK